MNSVLALVEFNNFGCAVPELDVSQLLFSNAVQVVALFDMLLMAIIFFALITLTLFSILGGLSTVR